MEETILLFIANNIRNSFLDPIMIFITHLGDHALIWVIISMILIMFKKTRCIGLMMITTLCLSGVINTLLIKNIVCRERPFNVIEGLTCIIKAPTDYAFPSGHSASASGCALIIYRNNKKYGIFTLILALLIALSRLYVGVHYPSDVLFGCLSGMLIAQLVNFIFCKYLRKVLN